MAYDSVSQPGARELCLRGPLFQYILHLCIFIYFIVLLLRFYFIVHFTFFMPFVYFYVGVDKYERTISLSIHSFT
jgi:hypothetical protein